MTDLRGRFTELADDDSAALDLEARRRILDDVHRRGPTVVKHARRRRVAVRVAGPVIAAGLAAVVLFPRSPAVRPCSTWAGVPLASVDGTMTMGARGRVVAAPGTRATAKSVGACDIVVELESGRVTVHADDLGGGTLLVRTERGAVTVRGTVFTVDHVDDVTVVEVQEGRVAWNGDAGEVLLSAPKRLRIEPSHDDVKTAALDDSATDTPDLESAFDSEPEPTNDEGTKRRRRRRRRRPETKSTPRKAPAADAVPAFPETQSADALVRRAEALRRAGDTNGARSAYRAAGFRGGPTGEAAWIALAGYELELGRPRSAMRALRERTQRYRSGALEVEGEWLAVRALAALGEGDRARAKAQQIIRRWPAAAQARAARKWLKSDP